MIRAINAALLGATLCGLLYLAAHGGLYIVAYHLGFRLERPVQDMRAACSTDTECELMFGDDEPPAPVLFQAKGVRS